MCEKTFFVVKQNYYIFYVLVISSHIIDVTVQCDIESAFTSGISIHTEFSNLSICDSKTDSD